MPTVLNQVPTLDPTPLDPRPLPKPRITDLFHHLDKEIIIGNLKTEGSLGSR